MRPDVRQLRYFLAVAEELNFTRAAIRLNVVQQSLSTAIAQLESALDMRLFERTTRAVSLTAAGEAWLPYARKAVAAVEHAAEFAADLAAGRAGRLRVGLAATGALPITPRLLREYARRYPQIEVATEHFDFENPTGGLRERRTDVALVRPPFAADDLVLIEFASEPRYAVLASEHALAGRSAVQFDELVEEPWMTVSTDATWCSFWQVAERRNGPVPIGVECRTLDDLFEAARAGRSIGLVPETVATAQPWPGLVFVLVHNIPPSTIAVATRLGDDLPAAARFVELTLELAAEDASAIAR